ncbi:MAG: hypothetical protein WD737_06640 [Gemmatimonadota bacterium]
MSWKGAVSSDEEGTARASFEVVAAREGRELDARTAGAEQLPAAATQKQWSQSC